MTMSLPDDDFDFEATCSGEERADSTAGIAATSCRRGARGFTAMNKSSLLLSKKKRSIHRAVSAANTTATKSKETNCNKKTRSASSSAGVVRRRTRTNSKNNTANSTTSSMDHSDSTRTTTGSVSGDSNSGTTIPSRDSVSSSPSTSSSQSRTSTSKNSSSNSRLSSPSSSSLGSPSSLSTTKSMGSKSSSTLSMGRTKSQRIRAKRMQRHDQKQSNSKDHQHYQGSSQDSIASSNTTTSVSGCSSLSNISSTKNNRMNPPLPRSSSSRQVRFSLNSIQEGEENSSTNTASQSSSSRIRKNKRTRRAGLQSTQSLSSSVSSNNDSLAYSSSSSSSSSSSKFPKPSSATDSGSNNNDSNNMTKNSRRRRRRPMLPSADLDTTTKSDNNHHDSPSKTFAGHDLFDFQRDLERQYSSDQEQNSSFFSLSSSPVSPRSLRVVKRFQTTATTSSSSSSSKGGLLVKGAGSQDMFAVQDTGNAQLLMDDCMFFCESSVRHSSNNNNSNSNRSVLPHQIESLTDLATLLSVTKNRRLLFFPTKKNNFLPVSQRRDDVDDDHPKDEPNHTFDFSVLRTVMDTLSEVLSIVSADETAGGAGESYQSVLSREDLRLLLSAATCLLHFVALDCTVATATPAAGSSSFSSSSAAVALAEETASAGHHRSYFQHHEDPDESTAVETAAGKAARSFREFVLSHKKGMQGVLNLILADPHTAFLRRQKPQSHQGPATDPASGTGRSGNPMASPVPAIHVPAAASLATTANRNPSNEDKGENDNTSVTSSLSPTKPPRKAAAAASPAASLSSSTLGSSVCGGSSVGSAGRTAAARRRLKKKRQHLDAISESQSDMQELSFASSEQSIRVPPPRKKRKQTKAGGSTSRNPPLDVRKPASPGATREHSEKGYGEINDNSSFSSRQQVNSNTRQQLEKLVSSLQVESSGGEDLKPIFSREDAATAVTSTSSCQFYDAGLDDSFDRRGEMGLIPLKALLCIIQGKCENDPQSCLDGLEHDDSDNDSHANSSPPPRRYGDVDDDDDHDDAHTVESHPVLMTNKLLRNAGVIPLLSQALAETLDAITNQLQRQQEHPQKSSASNGDDRLRGKQIIIDEPSTGAISTGRKSCLKCLRYLLHRVTLLCSLVDGACLLNSQNRYLFCQTGHLKTAGGYLTVGLARVLENLLLTHKNPFTSIADDDDIWGEICLTILRTLTSLTHENSLAAKDLEMPLKTIPQGFDTDEKKSGSYCGLNFICQVLFRAATMGDDQPEKALHSAATISGNCKLKYDAIIFCLNTLTNALESVQGSSKEVFLKITVPAGESRGNDVLFLTWLSSWLVDQTRSFRDAVQHSTFGSSPSCKHAERQLEKQEEEKLVLAGNGFVFLACLMVNNGADYDETSESNNNSSGFPGMMKRRSGFGLSLDCRKLILQEVPGKDDPSKFSFCINILKAFLNFYHLTVGDLSVAVVAPIKQLIEQLEAAQNGGSTAS